MNNEVSKLKEQLEDCKDLLATICLQYRKGIKPEDREIFIKTMVTFAGNLYLKLEPIDPETFDA